MVNRKERRGVCLGKLVVPLKLTYTDKQLVVFNRKVNLANSEEEGNRPQIIADACKVIYGVKAVTFHQ